MKVYIVEGHIDHEGFEILGVYAYMAAAESKADKERKKWHKHDHVEITEHEINQSYRWLKSVSES